MLQGENKIKHIAKTLTIVNIQAFLHSTIEALPVVFLKNKNRYFTIFIKW